MNTLIYRWLKPISTLYIFVLLSLSIGFAQNTTLKPLKGGERICWIGNSFSGFFGPVTDALNAVYKAADPNFKPIYFATPGKGCGIIKEYVVWGSIPGGTGAVDSIRNGKWDYVVFQTWMDAVNMYDVSQTFMGCGGPSENSLRSRDTLLKYAKILDTEAKLVGAKTMYYAPHVSGGSWVYEYQKSVANNNYVMSKMSNIFYSPVIQAWDSIRVDYPSAGYDCGLGFIKLMYSDCGHQNATGMALDAFTFYTIFSGGLSGEGLDPVFPVTMENPGMKTYLAKLGTIFGRKILKMNGFGDDFEAPSIPSGLTSSSITNSSFVLNWAPSNDNVSVTGYEIIKNGVIYGKVTEPSATITGLGSGLPYSITIRAYDAVGHYSKVSNALSVITSGTQIIQDYGFETPAIANNTYSYNPSGSSWTFFSNSGILTDNSGFNNCNNIQEGRQAAFLQYNGYITQSVSLVPSTYRFKLKAANRGGGNIQHIQIKVGTQLVDTIRIPLCNWSDITSKNFVITTSGNYTLEFKGLNPLGGDNTGHIDDVRLEVPFDTQAPNIPTGLTVSGISSMSVVLKWNNASDNVGVAGYKIFRGNILIGEVSDTSFNMVGLSPSTAYSVSIKAVDMANNVSAASNVVSFTTLAPDITPPSIPVNLAVSNLLSTTFNLNWDISSDNVGVVGYEVFIDGILYGYATVNAMPIPWRTPATTYSLRVRAKDVSGNFSDQSVALLVTTPGAPPDIQEPSVPLNLSASDISGTQAILSWSPATDDVTVAGYVLSVTSGIGTQTVSGTTHTLSGLTPLSNYSYAVYAFDLAYNRSVYSVPYTFTTSDNTTIANAAINNETNIFITIRPNPASKNVTLTHISKIRTIEIRDAFGKAVFHINNVDNSDETMIDLSSTLPGYYYVNFTGTDCHYTRKLIVVE